MIPKSIYAHSFDHIKNGSYFVESGKEISEYMNGDFMGFVDYDKVSRLRKFDYKKVKNLIPSSIQ